eukprot:PhF_6_TR30601/c0_g1_i2/m.45042/K00995/pgsA, PGS1; CDP-diacylglycerol--glycerol-3-phosphate 3-phosphatidyltransferase
MIPVYVFIFIVITIVGIFVKKSQRDRPRDLSTFSESKHSYPLPPIHPSVQGLVQDLHKKLLPFYVKSENIQFLHTPTRFHQTLVDMIKTANHRVILVSLYWSVAAPLERRLMETLEARLEAVKGLTVYIVMDRNRMVRTSKHAMKLFEGLEKRYPGRVVFKAYEVPMPSWFRYAPVKALRELGGVQHVKMYVVDDSCILSGANLSENYFSNRQDRYVWVKDAPVLCNWFQAVALCLLESLTKDELSKKLVHLIRHGAPDHNQQTPTDTVIYPYLQLGSIGLYYDSAVLLHVLQRWRRATTSSPAGGKKEVTLHMTSAYFNFTAPVLGAVLKTDESVPSLGVRILTASLTCNCFNGVLVTGWVPHLYLQLSRTFHHVLRRRGMSETVGLWEWDQKGHTFHAKGMWLEAEGGKVPFMTVGSSNLGKRSEIRDLELN